MATEREPAAETPRNLAGGQTIRSGQSCAPEAQAAVREFHAAVNQPDMALVFFFCSSDYDLDALAAEMRVQFGDVQVIGCTTAGEFGPAGFCERSLCGASLSATSFAAVTDRLGSIQDFTIERGLGFGTALTRKLRKRCVAATPANTFAFLMIDGLSVREEPVTRTLQHALGPVPLVGGSAGDGLRFGSTYVYHEGRFHQDSAILTVISTTLPFKVFMAQHFVAAERPVVVTRADADRRIVHELDGRPAAAAYADLVGISPDDLDPMRFAASPMVVKVGGRQYVRSISKVEEDGSLRFFCAIDEGMVLRLARAADLIETTEQAFADVRAEIGEPQLVIGCDCILRHLETRRKGLTARLADIMRRNRAIGFNTYGEQYRGMHVNQTLTGIAIGTHEAAAEPA